MVDISSILNKYRNEKNRNGAIPLSQDGEKEKNKHENFEGIIASVANIEFIKNNDDKIESELYNLFSEKLISNGYRHYEISNYAKPGFESKHNLKYWEYENYLGLGPSAHSFNNYSRQWNVKNVNSYIDSIRNNKSFHEGEELSIRTRFNEYIMTSLRTMWGIDLDFVEREFEKEGYDYIINLAGKFKGYGLMKQDKKNLVLTNQGKIISDNIISEFMIPADE